MGSSKKTTQKPSQPGKPSNSLEKVRKLKQAGYKMVAFEVSDDLDPRYQYIEDEVAEATWLIKRGQLEKARAAFESIIAREPRVKESYTNLGVIYTQLDQPETAEALFLQAVEKFPGYAYPRANLAQIYLQRGQVGKAEEILTPGGKVLRKFSSAEFGFYFTIYSDILAEQGNYKAALSWLKMLSQALPGGQGILRRRIGYSILGFIHRLISKQTAP